MAEEENKDQLILSRTKDFTTSKLVKYLTDKYGSKESGKPFTIQDLQQYMGRLKLPKRYGGQRIESVESEEIGVKLIRVHFEEPTEA